MLDPTLSALDDPAIGALLRQFIALNDVAVERLAEAMTTAPYLELMNSRADIEERAYRLRHDMPTRQVTRAVGNLARSERHSWLSEATWTRAEIALHFALVGIAGQRFATARDLGLLLGPWHYASARGTGD